MPDLVRLLCLLLTGAAVGLTPRIAAAQQSLAPASPAAPQTQLDRIEGKLDELLRRLPAQAGPSSVAAGTAAPTPSKPSASAEQVDQPGALALVRPAPRDERVLADVPQDSVGGFVYAGGALPLSDPSSRNGIRYAGQVGYELQGWLQARQDGRYQLAADVTARYAPGALFAPFCFFEAWLEGRSLGQQRQLVRGQSGHAVSASLVVGVDLSTGLYKFRAWIACTPQQGVGLSAELLLKAPSELNLRSVKRGELLHREATDRMSQ